MTNTNNSRKDSEEQQLPSWAGRPENADGMVGDIGATSTNVSMSVPTKTPRKDWRRVAGRTIKKPAGLIPVNNKEEPEEEPAKNEGISLISVMCVIATVGIGAAIVTPHRTMGSNATAWRGANGLPILQQLRNCRVVESHSAGGEGQMKPQPILR
ncbi:MAG: hypothetical protein WA705_29585 [Candidatus Ozemobacteraceae bacterium]